MKLIAQLKLLPSPDQATALRQTFEAANRACNYISAQAWHTQTFGKFALQKLCYDDVRTTFQLGSQLTIRCLAKVGDSYKLDHQTQRTYRRHGSIAYDDRILSFNCAHHMVSIWTLTGRQAIPYVAGLRQQRLLTMRQGESDLVYRQGKWFLLVTCTVDEPTPEDVDAALGVDLGIVNLATDSDGESVSGGSREAQRQWYTKRRTALQQVGTKSAKRRLKQLSGRQRRFQRDINHQISTQVVQKAQRTQRKLKLEDLTGIRQRTEPRVQRVHRAKHSNWGFRQLRTFITYKAALAGVQVDLVDPRNTSRTCSQPTCGYCDQRNRIDQAQFRCLKCGYTAPADYNAACVIRDRAAVIGLWCQTNWSRCKPRCFSPG